METKKTTLQHWTHSVQITSNLTENEIDVYLQRIKSTVEKMNYCVDTFYKLEKLGLNLKPYNDHIRIICEIRDTIGVYRIYHPHQIRGRVGRELIVWDKYMVKSSSNINPKDKIIWMDYFGENKGITESGGYIILSLSQGAISYMNSIRDIVSSLTTSVTV